MTCGLSPPFASGPAHAFFNEHRLDTQLHACCSSEAGHAICWTVQKEHGSSMMTDDHAMHPKKKIQRVAGIHCIYVAQSFIAAQLRMLFWKQAKHERLRAANHDAEHGGCCAAVARESVSAHVLQNFQSELAIA